MTEQGSPEGALQPGILVDRLPGRSLPLLHGWATALCLSPSQSAWFLPRVSQCPGFQAVPTPTRRVSSRGERWLVEKYTSCQRGALREERGRQSWTVPGERLWAAVA